jgi:hypothetical protein
MGPYMALIVPSSFYRIDAGLHAMSFSLDFNEHKQYLKIKHLRSCAPEKYFTRLLLKYFFGARGVKFLAKRRENVQIGAQLRRCLISLKTVEISRAKFHEIQKTNNAHDVTMTSNTYRFC